MGPRGSADPTHEGRDGLPPVRDFSPGRRHRQHAEASRGHGRIRAPPRWEFRLQALGPHTMPGRVAARSRTRQAPASKAVCDAPHVEGNSAPRSTTPRHIRRRGRHFRSHPPEPGASVAGFEGDRCPYLNGVRIQCLVLATPLGHRSSAPTLPPTPQNPTRCNPSTAPPRPPQDPLFHGAACALFLRACLKRLAGLLGQASSLSACGLPARGTA